MEKPMVDPAPAPADPKRGMTRSIGRDHGNDLVIDHPTVSRRHAVLQRIGDGHFIMDLGSENGTRVNGRTAGERRALAPGDKVRIGQVRATFVVADDAAQTRSLHSGAGGAPDLQPGILFNCVCGVRLWAKQEAATGLVTCRQCNAKVVVPEESTNPDSGETVSGVAFATAIEALAAPVQTGTCSICQWQTNAEDDVTGCPACGLTFHAECWSENCGCSAYGCAQVNTLRAGGRASEVGGNPINPASSPTDDPPGVEARLSVEHVLLAASVIGGVLGLLAFGAMPLIVLILSLGSLARRQRAPQAKLLFIAAGVSLIGVLAGAAVSSMVWLGWSPGGAVGAGVPP